MFHKPALVILGTARLLGGSRGVFKQILSHWRVGMYGEVNNVWGDAVPTCYDLDLAISLNGLAFEGGDGLGARHARKISLKVFVRSCIRYHSP